MNTHPIKAIIFDCDGTLVDSEHAYFLALRKAFKEYDVDLNSSDYSPFVGKAVGLDAEFIQNKIGAHCGEKLLSSAAENYYLMLEQGLPAIQPTLDFLHSLAEKKEKLNLKIGLASAAKKADIMTNLKNLGIDQFFDVILSGCDDLAGYEDSEGVNKPKPYIYLQAAKELNVLPEECIAIEDSHTGVISGVEAGCFTVAVPNPHTLGHDLSRAHAKIDCFSAFTVEDFLIAMTELKLNTKNHI